MYAIDLYKLELVTAPMCWYFDNALCCFHHDNAAASSVLFREELKIYIKLLVLNLGTQ